MTMKTSNTLLLIFIILIYFSCTDSKKQPTTSSEEKIKTDSKATPIEKEYTLAENKYYVDMSSLGTGFSFIIFNDGRLYYSPNRYKGGYLIYEYTLDAPKQQTNLNCEEVYSNITEERRASFGIHHLNKFDSVAFVNPTANKSILEKFTNTSPRLKDLFQIHNNEYNPYFVISAINFQYNGRSDFFIQLETKLLPPAELRRLATTFCDMFPYWALYDNSTVSKFSNLVALQEKYAQFNYMHEDEITKHVSELSPAKYIECVKLIRNFYSEVGEIKYY